MIKKYLEQIAEMTKREFDYYQLECYNKVVVRSYKEHPEVKKLIEKFLKGFTPQIKDCYRTSAFVVGFDPKFQYVCGYTHHLIPIEHAWNCYDGFHFDLTAELALETEFEEYGSIKIINHADLIQIINRKELPPTLPEIFRYEKEKKGL